MTKLKGLIYLILISGLTFNYGCQKNNNDSRESINKIRSFIELNDNIIDSLPFKVGSALNVQLVPSAIDFIKKNDVKIEKDKYETSVEYEKRIKEYFNKININADPEEILYFKTEQLFTDYDADLGKIYFDVALRNFTEPTLNSKILSCSVDIDTSESYEDLYETTVMRYYFTLNNIEELKDLIVNSKLVPSVKIIRLGKNMPREEAKNGEFSIVYALNHISYLKVDNNYEQHSGGPDHRYGKDVQICNQYMHGDLIGLAIINRKDSTVVSAIWKP